MSTFVDLVRISFAAAKGMNLAVLGAMIAAFALVVVGLALTTRARSAPLIYGVVGNLALLYTTAVAMVVPGSNSFAVTFHSWFVGAALQSLPIESWTFAALLVLFAALSHVLLDPRDSRRLESDEMIVESPAPAGPAAHNWNGIDNRPRKADEALATFVNGIHVDPEVALGERTMAYPANALPLELRCGPWVDRKSPV